jgi:16S rRNA (adenine1518-N6/adenine1519-N6)-dimethyltransferase
VLGQHYLVDEEVIDDLIARAAIRKGETVMEIGTGKGAVTSRLSQVADRVEAFEIDHDNYEETRESLLEPSRVRLHLGDAFKYRVDFDVLVSSLPYSKSSTFVEWLSRVRYKRAVVIVQDDFARKTIAPPGNRNYRAISVITQLSSEIKLGGKVGRDAFVPPPRVTSRVMELTPRLRLSKRELVLIKKLFTLRRRTLGAAIHDLNFQTQPPDGNVQKRIFQLSPAEVYEIVSRYKLDTLKRMS